MVDKIPRPPQYGQEHAAVFQYQSVATAYPNRPPYPDELYDVLHRLIVDSPHIVLELGCGHGEIARRLAPDVDRVDAVDPSQAMIEVGTALPGGSHPNLRWVCSSGEEFDYPADYSLIITADSLGWMAWEVVFPLMSGALSTHGRLVMVSRGHSGPWSKQLPPLMPKYSTIERFESFDMMAALVEGGLFEREESLRTGAALFRQSVDGYLDFWHSRAGFSRERMGLERAAAFAEEVRRLVEPYAKEGILQYEVTADVAWGRPRCP